MSFSQKLKELRQERDLTQAEVAKAVGVYQRHVSAWESNRNKPSLESVMALAKFFSVSTDYLLFDNVPREGVAAIDDFELYEYFRKTEALPKEKKDCIKTLIDGVVLTEKLKELPELAKEVKQPVQTTTLRKVAGRR
jgi:transcriptional regulator with XRE-family HTH domain